MRDVDTPMHLEVRGLHQDRRLDLYLTIDTGSVSELNSPTRSVYNFLCSIQPLSHSIAKWKTAK